MANELKELGRFPVEQALDLLGSVAYRLPLDEWAARYREVAGETPYPGPWDPAHAPMSIEPMRAFSEEGVEWVTVSAPTQLMKSKFAINVAIYTVVHGDDCLFFEPDEVLAREFLQGRIRPSLRAYDPRLIAGRREDVKKLDSAFALRVPGGGTLRAVTPGMRTGVTSRTARVAVIDEIDKMGEPRMHLWAIERTTTYQDDARVVAVSAPTIDAPGTITRIWSEGSRGVWHGRCGRCSELVSVSWDRVQFERDQDGYWLPETARLVCQSCDLAWPENERRDALLAGEYIHADPDHPHRSYKIPGPAHLWRTIRLIARIGAEAWRAAMDEGDWPSYQAWVNGFTAEPWTDDIRGLSSRRLKRATYSLGARGADDLGVLDL